MRSEVNVKNQEKTDVATGSLTKILGRMPKECQVKECLVSGFVPS